MPSDKLLRFLRFIEHSMLFLIVSLVIFLAVLSAVGKLGPTGSYAGGGAVLLAILILYFAQRKIDRWQTTLMSQVNYIQNDIFSSLYDRSPVSYITIKTDGTIIGNNPASIKLLHSGVNDMAGVNFFSLIKPDAGTDAFVLESKISAGLTVNEVEASLSTFSGEMVWVILSVHAYRNEKQRLVSLVDITEQKHVDTAKSEFVALATHQLRTPVAAIRWNMELLQRNLKDTKTDDQARYMSKIERNVFRMINLINDFLSVSKLEMGTFAAKEENINLSEFFSTIIEEFAEKISEKKIEINRNDSPPQITIKTDSRLLHIIVSNLVSNAVKYLHPEGKLDLSYELKDSQIEIIVADDGIGIPESEIDQLFTKFFRASNASSHQAEGTGLGLYVVKQSAKLLGGNIVVKSGADKGARFVVTIPADVVSEKEIG